MKGAIFFIGKFGSTQQYAQWISEHTSFPVFNLNKENPDPTDYDLLVLGSSIMIARPTIQKWLKAYRLENRIEPLRRGHNPAAFEGANLKALDECVARRPDITLDELKEIFASRVNCSRITIHNTLRRLKWEYKKSRYERVSKADQT